MEVIILIALIFVILNLANKYLKVPKDDNQRYDGINNRFYGEGYTGNAPVPPTNDEDQEGGSGDLQDEQTDGGTEFGGDEIAADEQADEDTEFGDEIGAVDQTDEQSGYVPADRPEVDRTEEPVQQEVHSSDDMADQPANLQPDSPDAGGSVKEAPAGDNAICGNIGNAPGVVIDTEVHIDATMPQDSGKS